MAFIGTKDVESGNSREREREIDVSFSVRERGS